MFDSPVFRFALLPCVAVFYVWFVAATLGDRRRVFALARHTFVESLRQKILLIPLLFMGVAIGTSLYTAAFREQGRIRVVTASCLWSLTVFGMVVAILLAARSVPDDISYRTIYSVLTKPVKRMTYLTGKILGFSAVCLLILAIMGGGSLALIRWVGRGAVLEARRTISGGKLSVEGAGLEIRDGRTWVVHEPGSTLKWRFEGLPELSREETALVTLKLKTTPADPSAAMPVVVEFKNADDNSDYLDIPDARGDKKAVKDLPGAFVIKGVLDVIAAPANGWDRIADERSAVVLSAAGKNYEAKEAYRRANSWGNWRFTQVPEMEKDAKVVIRIRLHTQPGEGRKAINARVRLNPKGALGPYADVLIEDGKPVEVELAAPADTAMLAIGGDRVMDVAIIPQDVGDSYEIAPEAVELRTAGRTLTASTVVPEGYGLTSTSQTCWISRALKRTATWHFSDVPTSAIPIDKVLAEGNFKIGKAREIDLSLTLLNPSAPDLHSEVLIHAVRKEQFEVAAKPAEFSFDRKLLDSDGRMDVRIRRNDPTSVLGLPHENCIVLYARPGSFDLNFLTAVTVIFFQIVLIIAISVASSTVLSWPVSVLLCFFVFFCGYIIDIMRNAAEILNPYAQHVHGAVREPTRMAQAFNKVIEIVLGFLSYILPDFRKFEVSEDVIHNRAISGISLTGALLYAAVYVAIAFAVAHLLFRRREIE